MKLQDVLQKVEPKEITGACDIEISGVQIDSRQITKGDLFVAERGTQVDGHKFIPAAIEKGAVAVVCEEIPTECPTGVTFIKVTDSEDAVGPICTQFYGDPSKHIKLVGVTGTNGKTTTVAVKVVAAVEKFAVNFTKTGTNGNITYFTTSRS